MIDNRHRNIALLVASCFFMENLDGTIVTTAAPRIGKDLHVASTEVGLVVTAYLVTLAVLIPLSGWMVARVGTRKVFLSAIVVFTTASFLCSTSVNLGELVAMRVLQGCGGAMMVPVGRLAVLGRAEKLDIIKLTAYIVWPGLVAPVVAPLAGGLITTYASWRWLFLINIPLGVAALVLAIRLMPSSEPSNPPRLDVVGVLLTVAGLGGVTFSAHLLAESTTSAALAVACSLASIAVVAVSVRHLLASPAPLVDQRTLSIRSFRGAVGGGSLFGMTIYAVPFLLPLLFENVFGWSPVKSGSVVLFVFVGNIGIKPVTTRLLNRLGFRDVLRIATAGATVSVVLLGLTTRSTPIVVIALVATASGVFRSIGFTAYNTLSFSDVPQPQMRHATSLFATFQQLSSGLGVAFATVALRVAGPIGHLFSGRPDRAEEYRIAFILMAGEILLACVSAFRLPTDTGDAIRSAPAKAPAKS